MGLLSLLFGCKPQGASGPFEKKDGVWHYREHPIAEADAGTFVPLSDHYAKDKARAYYADSYRQSSEYFLTRRYRVTVVERADVGSFRYLSQDYARDDRRIYFEGKLFPVKDPATFEILDEGFAKDRLTGYYLQEPIPESDGSTFTVVGWHYSKDAKTVFYSWLEPGTEGRPPTSKALRLIGALPGSIKALESGYALDSGQVYYRGKPLTKDPGVFRMLRSGYAIGKDRVYYDGAVVEGADPASFVMLDTPTDSADSKDARAQYQQGRRVGKLR